jgi:hypothetical protein
MSESKSLIITLCGSTRFTEQMLLKQWELRKQGHLAIGWAIVPNTNGDHIAEAENVPQSAPSGSGESKTVNNLSLNINVIRGDL